MSSAQRTWLITGASSGLGAEVALAALQRGDKVIGTGRNIDKAREDNQTFAQQGGRWLALDVTSLSCESTVAEAVSKYNIDVLVNNAGYAEGGTLEDTSMDNIRAQFETNVFGTFQVLKGCIPHFRRQRKGSIVNISSTAAVAPHCYFSSYAATKFALEGASESLVEELSPFGISVIIIEPGALRTNFFGALSYTPISSRYIGAIVEETVEMFKTFDGKQPGDPKRAGAAIVDVVRGEGNGRGLEGVLRIPLGPDAVQKTKAKAAALKEQWAKGEELGNSCAYD